MSDLGGNIIIDLIGGLLGGGDDGPSRSELIDEWQRTWELTDEFRNEHPEIPDWVRTLGDYLDWIETGSDDVVIDVNAIIDTVIASADDHISDLSDFSQQEILQLITSGSSQIQTIGQHVENNLNLTAEGVLGNIGNFANSILGGINSDVSDAIGIITGLFGQTNGLIQDLLRGNKSFIEILTARGVGAIEDILREHTGFLENTLGGIGESIIPLIEDAAFNNEAVSNRVIDALDEEIAQSQRNAEQAENNLADAIDAITGESESALATTRQALVESGEAEVQATETAGESISDATIQSGERVAESIERLTGESGPPTKEEVERRIEAAVNAIFSEGNCPEDFANFVHEFVAAVTTAWAPATAFSHILGEVSLHQSIFGPALMVLGNCLAQTAARAVPTSLADTGTLIEQYKRGIIPEERAVNDMLSQGYTLDRAASYLGLTEEIPEIGLVQTWWLRGFIDTETAVRSLEKLGYTNESIENLLRMSFFIPPVQDLITMAVREVFSPEIAQQFGQFEDYPDDFTGFAGQQGISEEWARRYWAAHWSLPSVQQGFEMFQRRIPGTDRKIISPSELDVLLKALDIMPFWRDKLTNIAYRPITRVDIRRIADLGLIDYDEVQKRYEDIGFAPPDAALMTEFTRAYNSDDEAASSDELEGLTRSMVVRLYKQGAFSRDQAKTALLELDHSDTAANIILASADIDMEIDERESQTDLILQQAKAGVITFDEAFDRLAGLGLEPTELNKAQIKLQREQAKQNKLPSFTQVTKMLDKDIITRAEYLITLERMGYSNYWSARLLQLAISD